MFKKHWLAPLSLFVLAGALYARSIGADFLRWDDRQNILLNPFIDRALWSQTWTRPYYNMFIPVTYSVWTLLWHVTKEPWLFHLVNVLMHAGNVVWIFVIANRVFRGETRAAWLTAAIFAMHPLQVEAVAWISSLRDLLAAFFGLWATHLVLSRERVGWWIFATLLFGLGLLSKPSLAVLPVGVAILAWACGTLDRRRVIALATWLVPSGAAIVATKMIQQLDADLRLSPLGLGERVVVAFDTIGFYLSKVVAPYPLGSDYGRAPKIVLADDASMTFVVLGGIGVLAALAHLWRARNETRAGLLWAGLFISPVLGLVPFQAQGQSTVSDRYMYLSMIGIGFAFAALARRRAYWTAPVMLALAGLTVARADVWMTNEGFFLDMLGKNPGSFVANSSLGVEYILQRDSAKALHYLNEAIRIKPMDSIPRTNLAQFYLLANRPDMVTREVASLYKDPEFLRINQTETRALASGFRLIARAYWLQGQHAQADDFYCHWYKLDWENEDGKKEYLDFMKDAAEKKIPLPTCG